MKRSELEIAIIKLSKSINKEDRFQFLLKDSQFPEITKYIVYELFMDKFDRRSCSNELYSCYSIVHSYCIELSKNGFVKFENETE